MLSPAAFDKKIRVGMLGLEGHISEILSPIKDLPNVEIAAIWEPDPKRLQSVTSKGKAKSAKQYSSPEEMLDREHLDVVSICGPNGDRAKWIVECAKRKVNVVAEKPLAINSEDLVTVKKAVSESGIHLSMLLPMRFWPSFETIRKIVAEGQIGEVAQAAAQKSYKLGERSEWMRRKSSFGGTIPYIGIHMVDLIRSTTGRELTTVAAFQGIVGGADASDMENTATCIYKLDNGGAASIRLDYLRPETAGQHGDDRLRIAGTEGVIEYRDELGIQLITQKKGPQKIEIPPQTSWLFLDFLNNVYGGKPSGLTLKDIYRANEIVLATRKAAEQNQVEKI